MQNQYINFKRKRELGEIITDTFKFLRQNYKPIFRNSIRIAGIPFLIFITATAFNTQNSFGENKLFNPETPLEIFDSASIIISTLLVYLSTFIFITFLNAGIMAIIKSYITNKGVIIDQEVSTIVKEKLKDIALVGLGKALLLVIGFMLCVIPGVYISIPFFIIFPILIFENKKTSEVFSTCFHLIKDNWWASFASVFILGVLWYIIGMIFSIPSMIYMGIKMFTAIQENTMSDPSNIFDMITVILTVIASTFQYIAYIFVPIGAAFIYFNLNEQKNQTGTLEQIDRLGE